MFKRLKTTWRPTEAVDKITKEEYERYARFYGKGDIAKYMSTRHRVIAVIHHWFFLPWNKFWCWKNHTTIVDERKYVHSIYLEYMARDFCKAADISFDVYVFGRWYREELNKKFNVELK